MKKIIAVLLFFCFNQLLAQSPNDCVNAIVVCGNGNFSSNATGIGNLQEINGFCSGFEHNSIWLKINVVQSGTLGFHIRPNDADINVDYDFWVFGPNPVCGNLGSPIRCSTTNPVMAGLTNNYTGMYGSTTSTQNGPGANGNGYVRWLNVLAGQSYYIVIDRPIGDGGFELEWIGTATQGTGAFAPPPTANPIADYISCSTNANTGIFDLNTVRSSINADLVANNITFHTTLENATDGVGALPNIMANSTNPQTIFARVTDNTTGCSSVTDFDLVVYPVPQAAIALSASTVCPGEEITVNLSGTPNATVTYQIDSGADQQAVLDDTGNFSFTYTALTNSTLSLTQAQIIDDEGAVICSQNLTSSASVTVADLQLPTLATNSPICIGQTAEIILTGSPLSLVHFTVNGLAESVNLSATGSYTHTITNVTSQLDIELTAVVGAVAPFCTVALTDTAIIQLNALPIVVAPSPYLLCDTAGTPTTGLFQLTTKNAEITNNDASLAVSYYLTQPLAQLGNPADALPATYQSTSGNQTIYVRVETAEGCAAFTELVLQVVPAPVAQSPTPISQCVTAGLNTSVFDLTTTIAQITAGNTAAVEVDFYHNLADAQSGVNPIANPAAFSSGSALLYVRVQSGNCFEIVELSLQVMPSPVIQSIGLMTACDTDTDGFTTFNLDSFIAPLLGNLPTAEYTVRFYADENTATTAPLNFIATTNPYTNTTAFNQTIWVRVTNNASLCFAIDSIDLQVTTPLELPTGLSLSQCDTNNDGFANFNLTAVQNALLVNASNPSQYAVHYYHTVAGAQQDLTAERISAPTNFTNLSAGTSTIGIRVVHLASGCFSTSSLSLQLIPLPDFSGTSLPDLTRCASGTNTTASFDLTVYESNLLGSIPNLTVTYHVNHSQAQSGTNPIVNPADFSSSTSTVYVRVVNSSSSNPVCAAILPLNLIVNPLPVVMSTAITICDSNLSGFASFDLQAEIPAILGANQAASLYSVQFFVDSEQQQSIPTGNYTNTVANLQVIYVKVTHNTTQCFTIVPFELRVQAGAQATQPSPWLVCDTDENNDGVASFDLTSLNSIVLNGQNPADFQVSYHLNAIGAANGSNPIADPANYQNTLSPNQQTIYIRVKNSLFQTSCIATTTVLLRVEKRLEPTVNSLDGSNTICVNYATGVVERTVTLRSSIQGNNYTYTWFLNGNAIAGATSSTYTVDSAAPGIYTVVVENPNSALGCSAEPSPGFEVIQSGPAVLLDYQVSGSFGIQGSITVQVEGYGEYWFQLNDGPMLNNGGYFANVPPGLHTVTVHDLKTENPSCDPIVITDLRIIDYPKFFTPNGDGYNDYWNISALRDQPDAYILIYDRYGKLLASIAPNGVGWDGMLNGNPLVATDYWFVVYYSENGVASEFRAHFSLKR